MLAITWRDIPAAREAIRKADEQASGPVGVNIVLDSEAKSIPTRKHVELCVAEAVPVVSFSFGESAPYIDQIQAYGGTVLETVGTPQAARKAVAAGVDGVVAQGWESGGHVQSEVATMPLVPRVVDAVADTPVLAAGGIGDGRGIAAALLLGADGVWLGTRFVATEEALAHDQYRQEIIDADATDTVIGTVFDRGWPDQPHRTLANETTDRKGTDDGPTSDTELPEQIATTPDGNPVYRYEDSLAIPGMEGNLSALPLYAGQSTGVIEHAPSATAVTRDLIAEAEACLEKYP